MASSSYFREFEGVLFKGREEAKQKTETKQERFVRPPSERGERRIATPVTSSSSDTESESYWLTSTDNSRHSDSHNQNNVDLTNVSTGSDLIVTVGSSALENEIKRLCSKMNIFWGLPKSLDRFFEHRLKISARLIRILRGELESNVLAQETPALLKRDIRNILNAALPWRSWQVTLMSDFPGDLSAPQENVSKTGVKFEQLQETFLSGELVYAERSELATNGVPGQCWKVDYCEYMESETPRLLIIKTLEWKWDNSRYSFHLLGGTIRIEEYAGRVSFKKLGIIPVAMMQSSAWAEVQEKLISRGKLYMNCFKSVQSVWEYHGPATQYASPYKWFSRPTGPKLDGFEDGPLVYAMEYSTIKSRVIFAIFIPQISPNEDPTGHMMDMSEPIRDETYIIFCPSVWVQPVTSLGGPLRMVHLDHFSPVTWNKPIFDTRDNRICIHILSIVQTFQPFTKVHTQLEGKSAGLIMIVSGDILRTMSIMGAVAEHDQRSLLEVDLLDFTQQEDGLFRVLESRLYLAARLRGLILLQNFAPLVARRSFDRRGRCEEITKFIDFLEIFPGIITLCLDRTDSVDGKLKKLRPVCVDIDDIDDIAD